MFFSIEREGEGCGDDDKAISLSNRLRIKIGRAHV